ncbi:microtubule-associated protein futsch-like isoform X2 [Penaeus chinensis]|uniref:microtubule-associated protein futsch-like isoform X2 n=1 Tax=Penaeus chinensis TaxID=139456 RepID=UPI001FB63C8F|nr:microtubule-associated protein futsch-like isoform X2 [Penaeus chinensis]
MERRGSAIFYSDDEGDEGRPTETVDGSDEERPKETADGGDEERPKENADGEGDRRPKEKADEGASVSQEEKEGDSRAENYSAVAVRAKLSVEVEQRKRLGAWAKRVLVLDGATLYAYKTKGEGGSVGGWAVGGADVHVGKGNDSTRDDGRHILVVSRPPAYKLTFSFNTTYEQARMVQALSSSGATVTGLDAIMLMKNLRRQQEEEEREEAGGVRRQSLLENCGQSPPPPAQGAEISPAGQGQGSPERQSHEGKIGDLMQEISTTIFSEETGVVSNPLYTSLINLTSPSLKSAPNGDLHLSSHTSGNAAKASQTALGPPSEALAGGHKAKAKVNPVPKPPRSGFTERSQSWEPPTRQVSDDGTQVRFKRQSFSSFGEGSTLACGGSGESSEDDDVFGEVTPEVTENLIEAKNQLLREKYSSEKRSDSEVSDAEAAENSKRNQGKVAKFIKRFESIDQQSVGSRSSRSDEEDEEEESEKTDDTYEEDINKMKLERGLSIDSQSGGFCGEYQASELISNIARDSPQNLISDKIPLSFSDENAGTDKEESSSENGDKEPQSNGISTNSEEQFEKLYLELSQENSDQINGFGKINGSEETTPPNHTEPDPRNGETPPKHPGEENGEANDEDIVDSPDTTPMKRVNSIIKKKNKDSASSGTVKRVQFNLDVQTSEPPPVPDDRTTKPTQAKKKEPLAEQLPGKKSPKDPTPVKAMSPPEAPPNSPVRKPSSPTSSPTKKKAPDSPSKKGGRSSPSPTRSPSKKKGILSSLFASSASKKGSGSSTKEETSKGDEATRVSKPQTKQASGLQRQATLDMNAPVVMSGVAEMAGSLSGRLNSRRMEVRDGHVLAFMPKSSAPSTRISLYGLSVMPVLGGAHAHALTLNRGSRCMMLVKLGSREEMMRWINTLSDEVIKMTPAEQRSGLTLYPTPEKDSARNDEDATDEEGKKEDTENAKGEGEGETKNRVSEEEVSEVTEVQENGDVDDTDGAVVMRKDVTSLQDVLDYRVKMEEREKITYFGSGDDAANEETSQINKENTSDDIASTKNQAPESRSVTTQEDLKAKDLANNGHPPLRRLSGQVRTSSQSDSDTVDNFLMANTLPEPEGKRTAVNGHRPLTRLYSQPRALADVPASRKTSGTAANKRLTNGVSEVSASVPRGEQTSVGRRRAHEDDDGRCDQISASPRGPIKSREPSRNHVAAAGASSHINSHIRGPSRSGTLLEPRQVEIVEQEVKPKAPSESQRISKRGASGGGGGDRRKEEDNTRAPTPVKDDIDETPTITWSVAATREKFELLCSVSGEDKLGKLTTKTPISRKRSARNSVKKKRSLDGTGTPRRQSVKRSVRRTLSNMESSNSFDTEGLTDADPGRQPQSDGLRLPPVRDLRKNFEAEPTRNLALASPSKPLSAMPSKTSVAGGPAKPPVRRTSNILQQDAISPASSPEPGFITSKTINGRPKGRIRDDDKGPVTRSLLATRPTPQPDSQVVICWRGPYIAQESEQAVLANISNAFLAKRRLLAKEVMMARIQERLSQLEETMWDLQAAMAELDNRKARNSLEWGSLERSLRTAEEDTAYWQSRLAHVQREAEDTREKLATALAKGLAQHLEEDPHQDAAAGTEESQA